MRQPLDMPSDLSADPIQVLSLNGTPKNLQASATTNSTTLPTNVSGGWVIRVASTEDCYINFGGSGVTATTSSYLFPKGVEYLKVPKGATHIAVVRVVVTGIVSITNVE